MYSADVAQISVIVEFIGGKITDMLLKMISLYRPDCKSSTRGKVANLTFRSSHCWNQGHEVEATDMGQSPRR